ncbi:sugar ABC transporter permease [Haladaptatus sp. W1]|uniref:Carbohydrate ABC transporter membrane protein 2, CUT1 family n=1 Tax=Haladaptatus paucihalophilus DX253 TaxID=797209 RepID=A0A1M6R7F7_HALPU|nr:MULTISPECIES: carbohydrate ABC transporter permease [Haladaptatus]ODR82677.1 sugar ABC transporter permease [Haladaptatus sp. W1]GKZ15511.1 ABC transporter permease [Haladaptatus sp. T7]SHK28360.1 carbohydrate ABC transporter membrane protein 2, CUT1 family [Haladaptatus paucihalophilus DX253]
MSTKTDTLSRVRRSLNLNTEDEWSSVVRDRMVAYGLLALYVVVVWFPIYYILITSFKAPSETLSFPITFYPHDPTLSNYVEIFQNRPFGTYTLNSLIVAGTTTLICVTLGTLSGYTFSRYDFLGNKALLLSIIAARMIPPIALIVPFFEIMSNPPVIGALTGSLYNTKAALILTYTFFNLPFAVWIMKNYFDGVPRSLDEQAQVDGCSTWEGFFKVILPVAKPGIAATAILAFIFSWNEFVFALVLTSSEVSQTLPIGVSLFVADDFIDWAHLAAGGMIAALPGILFGLFFQRYIVSGLTQGAVKE